MRVNVFKLVSSLIICQLVGYIGSLFTSPAIPEWYASLNKPGFTPPSWVFSAVWIFLFVLMGISLYLLWQNADKLLAKIPLVFFAIQLLLNLLWSVIFFGLKSPGTAFLEIIILWLAVFLTILRSFKISKPAAYLLVPYILWVSFAGILNFYLWQMNT